MNNPFKIANILSFERPASTPADLMAQSIITKELEYRNIPYVLHEFTFPTAKVLLSELNINGCVYEISPFLRSGNINSNLNFYYLENANLIEHLDLQGIGVILNERFTVKVYEQLAKAGVAFILCGANSIYNKAKLPIYSLRESHLQHGVIPCALIWTKDLNDIVNNTVIFGIVNINQNDLTGFSKNISCQIKGTSSKKIIFTAHYDSVPNSYGAYDNASGSAMLFSIVDAFKQKTPKFTMEFLWCGAEELGLLGSKDFASKITNIDNYLFCINFDMVGVLLGREKIIGSCDQKILDYLSIESKIYGRLLETKQDVYPSDATSFADVGIPGVNFTYDAPNNGVEIHSFNDDPQYLNESSFNNGEQYYHYLITKIVNANIFPFSKEIPKNIKDSLDKYFHR